MTRAETYRVYFETLCSLLGHDLGPNLTRDGGRRPPQRRCLRCGKLELLLVEHPVTIHPKARLG